MNPPLQWSFRENQISDTVAMISQVQDALSLQEKGLTCLWWWKTAPLLNHIPENTIMLSCPINQAEAVLGERNFNLWQCLQVDLLGESFEL